MNKKYSVKKFAQPLLVENRFFSALSFEPEDVEDANTELIDIEMLRVGTFQHRTYGEIEVTDAMLDSMVRNFNDNVLGREVSFDWNHEAKRASAWLKELEVRDGVLIGSIDFTDAGKKSVEEKEYGYFSIEYSDDYVDAESGDTFGPVVMGGALTNRPFISNLAKIEFEDSDSDFSLYRLEEKGMKKKSTKTKKRTPMKKDDNPNAFTLEELTAENEKLQSELDDLKEELGDNKKMEEVVEKQSKMLSNMQDQMKKLQEENKKAIKKSTENERKAKVAEIENKCEKLLNDEKHHPAIVAVAKEIMLSDTSSDDVIKLTETITDGEETTEREYSVSITGAIEKLLEAIPASQRANYKESSSSLSTEDIDESEAEKAEEAGRKRAFQKAKITQLSAVK